MAMSMSALAAAARECRRAHEGGAGLLGVRDDDRAAIAMASRLACGLSRLHPSAGSSFDELRSNRWRPPVTNDLLDRSAIEQVVRTYVPDSTSPKRTQCLPSQRMSCICLTG